MQNIKTVAYVTALTTLLLVPTDLYGADPYRVGEKWVFEHEGPVPMGASRDPVEGDRVTEVVSTEGSGAEQRWLVKQTWGANDENSSTTYVDPQGVIRKIKVGSMFDIEFSKPIPTRWEDLKVGEEKTIESGITVMGFDVPLKLVATRMEDASVTVPAGTFDNCRHIRVITHSVNQSGQPTKSRNDYWFHETVNNFVKEMFVSNYQSFDSFSGTSKLKRYTK